MHTSKLWIFVILLFASCKHHIEDDNIIPPNVVKESLSCANISSFVRPFFTDTCFDISLIDGWGTPRRFNHQIRIVGNSYVMSEFDDKLYLKIYNTSLPFQPRGLIASFDLCTGILDTSLQIRTSSPFSISNDGFIYYEEYRRLWKIRTDGSQKKQLTYEGAYYGDVKIRNDGKELYLSRTRNDTAADGRVSLKTEYMFMDNEGNITNIYKKNTDIFFGIKDFTPNFSTFISTIRDPSNPNVTPLALIDRKSQKEIRHRIAKFGYYQCFHPDGLKLLIMEGEDNMYLYNFVTDTYTTLRSTKGCKSQTYSFPIFTPDGKKIISNRIYNEAILPDGQLKTYYMISIMDIDGKNERIINLPQ